MFKKLKGKLVGVMPKGNAALVVGSVAALASPMAMADDAGLGALVLSKLGGVEADVTSILSLMIGVVTLFVLYQLIRKAVGK